LATSNASHDLVREVRLHCLSANELPALEQSLLQQSREALALSYSPYSQFPVGSAVLLSNGTVLKGANQENASYPAGLCAERVALFFASANYPREKVQSLAIHVGRQGQLLPYPCGICLQVIHELEQRQGQSIRLLLVLSTQKVYLSEGVENLLPFAFRQEHLAS